MVGGFLFAVFKGIGVLPRVLEQDVGYLTIFLDVVDLCTEKCQETCTIAVCDWCTSLILYVALL